MFGQLFLLFHFTCLVSAGQFTFNHFINPPADPVSDPTTANEVVVFVQGTSQRLKWLTTFPKSSLALFPVGTNPLTEHDTATWITRNVTIKSFEWTVAPPPGLNPGVYFFQLYQEGLLGITGNFPCHTFTINGATSSTVTTPSPASTFSTSIAVTSTAPVATTSASSIKIIPAVVSSSSALPTTSAETPTSTIAVVSSSSALPTTPAETPTSTIAVVVVSTTLTTQSESSTILESTTLVTSSAVPSSSSSTDSLSATATTPSIVPAIAATSTSTSTSETPSSSSASPTESQSAPISTSTVAPSPMFDTTQATRQPTFTKPEKIAVIIVPIVIVLAAIVGFLIWRVLVRRRGVEAMMKKSMKVREMSQSTYNGDGLNWVRWRDSNGTNARQSVRAWGGGAWRRFVWRWRSWSGESARIPE